MNEQTTSLPPFALAPIALKSVAPDTAVVQRALQACEHLQGTFNALLRGAPGVREVIDDLSRDTLAADAEQLLVLVRQRWKTYWESRAEGTPLSRKAHARAQYRRHFEATLDIACASDPSSAALRPILGVMDNPEWLRLGHCQLFIETPACAPGALIFSIEGELAQTLYLPGSSETFSHHPSRQALECSLSISSGHTSYSALDSIEQGFDALFESLGNRLFASLEHAPGTDLVTPSTALDEADRLHCEWRTPNVFAMPFALEPVRDNGLPSPSLFELGWLGADISWSTRIDLVDRQLDGLAKLSEQDLKECRRQQGILLEAHNAAQAEIDTLLASVKWHADAVPVTASPALLAAHRQALYAHARIQHLLGELTPAALALVEALFNPDDARVITASPVLQASSASPTGIMQEQVLHEAIVIARRTRFGTPDTTGPFVLYWVGEVGGLLQCDGQAALASYLGQHDADLSLRFELAVGDGLAHALDAQLAQARRARQTLQNQQGIEAAAHTLPWARQSLGQSLQVPRHQARDAALAHWQQQEQLAIMLDSSTAAFARMSEEARSSFKALASEYLVALHNSQALIERDLPDRTLFCQQVVSQELTRDFDDFDGVRIQLQLPISVTWRNHPIAGSGAPGTPTRPVLTASRETEDIDLVEVLLHNIDSPLEERLTFVLPKRADGRPLARSVRDGMDRDYLKSLARRLDLAERYESAIHATFNDPSESEHARAYRRECLVTPYRLMLELQCVMFHAKGDLDSAGQKILAVAITADSRAAFQVDGHDIRLLPAMLTAGGNDTDRQGTALSGVTFVEDRISGITLLYRPDHPTRLLRQYDNLEQARLALFEDSDDYLVSRALSGDPRAHRARLREARTHRFEHMIDVGMAWPSTTSLATHLLEAHRGRLVMRHRATSRANLDLYFEHFAVQGAGVLIGFKIALGALPFLGLPISAYDAFVSATQVVEAFSTGSTSDILQAINDLMVALIDVAMDTLGAGVAVNTGAMRRAARRPPLHQPGDGTTRPLLGLPVHRSVRRFSGLEHEQPLSMAGLRPAAHGRYRGIYRHPQGDFILVAEQPYKVSWDSTARTWQLDGNARNTWKRAIAQDEHGQWDTHFALYGVHRQGAGMGGGQALGHVADTLEPLWPAAIRERLPRWWRDHAYRQHNRLRDSITHDMRQLQPRADLLNLQMKRAIEQQGKLDAPLKTSLKNTLADAERIHRDCQAFQQVAAGRMRKRAQDQANDLAILICNGRQRLTSEASAQLTTALDEVDRLKGLLQQKNLELSANLDDKQLLTTVRALSDLRLQMGQARSTALAAVDDIREQIDQLRTWRRQVQQVGDNRDMFNGIDHSLSTFSDPVLNYMAVGQLAPLLLKPGQAFSSAGIRLQFLMKEPRTLLDRALYALHRLTGAKATAAQRAALMNTSLQHCERFRHQLQYWQSSYDGAIDRVAAKRLDSTLIAYEAHFTSRIRNPGKPLPLPRNKGVSQPRVFETTDNRLLVGEPDRHNPNVYRITGVNGRTEIYHQERSGKFTLSNPDTAPIGGHTVTLEKLRSEARRQLEGLQAYQSKVRQYADQGMDGASLEDLMHFKAADLDNLASRIAERATDDSLVQRLRSTAREAAEQGKALRIDYLMHTRKPEGAQLVYLLEEGLVRIEKDGGLVELRRTVDGRRDFLQEFVVLDIRRAVPRPLWYAHFHFDKMEPSFGEFVKAHLKTPAQRRLGREWQGSHVEQIWRGELTRPMARQHFAALF